MMVEMSSAGVRTGCLFRAAGVALVVQLVLAIFFLPVMIGTAGTENGEFCPTCPDWTNLDGWMAQKEAYERTHDPTQEMDQSYNHNQPSTGIRSSGSVSVGNQKSADANAVKPEDYPKPGLIVLPGAKLTGMTIIDVRSPLEYDSGHIQGARNLYWKDLQPTGALNIGAAVEALRNKGINNSDRVLVYGGSDDGASYVFWALSYLGHKNISWLDGGIDAAAKAGVGMDKSVPEFNKSSYMVRLSPSISVSKSNIDSWMNRSDVQIIDARPFTDYGTAKLTASAMPLEAILIYNTDSSIKDAPKLKEIFDRRLDKNKIQLVYGTPQASSLFYGLKLMGYNATLLDGSWWTSTSWAVNNVK